MTGFTIAVCAVFGLAIGSFLNVVIWRVPRGESVVSPPSACPACGVAIRGHDNIPVVSWVVLRGRCRDCAEPISARYPGVEVATAAAFGLVAWWLGPSWALPAFLYLAAISVALALIDLDTLRLPNSIVLPAYPVTALLLAIASWGTGDWGSLLRAAAGGGILYAGYFLLMMAVPKGMGFGDVKLAGVLGAYLGWVGWGALAVGAFAPAMLGGLFAVWLVLVRGAGRKTGIPFGPWMLAGTWIGLVAGESVWRAYLSLLVEG